MQQAPSYALGTQLAHNWPMAGNSPYNNGPPYAGNWKGRLPTSRTILRKVRTAGTCAGSSVTSSTAADCADAITWHAWQEATMACAVMCFKRLPKAPCVGVAAFIRGEVVRRRWVSLYEVDVSDAGVGHHLTAHSEWRLAR